MSTTTRAARGSKAASRAAEKPSTNPATEDVSLDLDSLEREDPQDPFTFRLKGHTYTIADPKELDWQKQLRAFGDPVYFLRHAMSAEDVEKFFNTELPGWKMEAVMKAYWKHFGLPDLGELAGSPT
ncbi:MULTISPECIES: hypothetical protein [unclassified Micromonospora]|uniref:hypothetical protein n=1 Tax=unclassified Micromonospora TaxID=2617518 RepID=UPI0033197D4D